jgi:methyl-accepting chemotaxis protein
MAKEAELLVSFGADFNDLKTAVEQAADSFDRLGKRLAVVGAAITATLTAIIVKSVAFGDNIGEMSERTGVSVETLTEFRLALEKNGSSLDSFATGMRKLSQNMVKASDDGGEAKNALDELGISATDAEGKARPLDAVFLDIAERFRGMEDGAEKTALAVSLFGRNGMELIPVLNLGRDGLRAEAEEARKLGIVLSTETVRGFSDADDSHRKFKASIEGLSLVLAKTLVPIFKGVNDALTGVIKTFTAAAEVCPPLTSFLTEMVGVAGLLATGVGAVILAYTGYIKNAGAIKGAIETIKVSTYLLLTENLSLVTVLKGLPAIAIAAFTGWKIGELINDVIGLRKAFFGVNWEFPGMAESFVVNHQKLRDLIALTGDSTLTVNSLVREYGSLENALSSVAFKYRDQIEAANKAKQQTSELEVALKALNLVGRDAAEKTLADMTRQFLLVKEAGAVSYGALVEMAGGIKELADKYDLLLNPTIRAFADDYMEGALESVRKMSDEFLRNLPRAIDYTTTEWLVLDALAQRNRITLNEVSGAAKTLDDQINELADSIGMSPATIRLMAYELGRLQLAMMGIHLPDLRIPENAAADVRRDLGAISLAWDDMIRDITQRWARAIENWVSGASSFKEFMTDTWEAIKAAFFRAIADMVAKWLTELVVDLIKGGGEAKSGVDKAMEGAGKAVNGLGDIVASVATKIGTVITTIASALTTALTTTATGISTAIVELATGIAAAINILAAAAPALLEIGLVAAAVYAAFNLAAALPNLISDIFGGGGGGADSDQSAWLRRIHANIQEIHDLMFIDFRSIFVHIQGVLDRINDGVWTTAGELGAKLDHMISIMSSLGSFQSGGIAWTPQVARIAEHEPEVIIPKSDLEHRTGIAAAVLPTPPGNGNGGGGVGGVVINYNPIIQAMDSQDIYKFMAGPGRDALVKLIRANTRGLTRQFAVETANYGGR